MKRVMQGIFAVGVGLGLVGLTQTRAWASQRYSAQRSASVRLVWRRSMGRHALVAATGARYSEHLGIRYGDNVATRHTVWYTNAHEELYDKASGQYRIYYHVNTANYQSGGWIWRGYLTAAPNVMVPQAAPQPVPAYIASEDAEDQAIMALFPNAQPDSRLTQLVQQFVVANNDTENFYKSWDGCLDAAGFTPAEGQRIELIETAYGMPDQRAVSDAYIAGKVSLKDYFTQVGMAMGATIPATMTYGDAIGKVPPVTYAQFAGWHIGVASVTANDSRDLFQGYPVIYVALMKGNN